MNLTGILNVNNEQDALDLKDAVSTLIIDEKGNLGKPSNYHWLRAVLILNKDLTDYLLSGKDLVLNDGSFEQWNSLINNELKTGFYKFLKRGKDIGLSVIKNIVDNYQRENNHWLFNLVKETIVDNGNEYSLIDYSESKKIKKYGEEIYLFNKSIWTEGNIILSTDRNQLIEVILLNNNFSFDWEWGNINGKYFRGYKPYVSYKSNTLDFGVVFDINRIYLQIGREKLKSFPQATQQYVEDNYSTNNDENNIIYFSDDYTTNEEILKEIDKLNTI